MLITCTCCYDLTKGTQDKDFSYSFSILSHADSLADSNHNGVTCFTRLDLSRIVRLACIELAKQIKPADWQCA